MIEERELSFTHEEPLQAWRLFRVRRTAEAYALCSPMIHSPAPPPWAPGPALAVCFESDHAAPAPGCRCGIYGAVEGTLDSLPGYLLDTRYDGDPWAYAEIACSGRIFLDARGVRCEQALLVRLALAEESFPAAVERERAREGLAARYGVPTQLNDTVPAWLINNAREQGSLSTVKTSISPRS
jgi:hypothetical protein